MYYTKLVTYFDYYFDYYKNKNQTKVSFMLKCKAGGVAMSICIFPGTFNPIHKGHLKMAEYALDKYNFDKIIFISDYVEDTRRYESCVKVRNLLFNGFDDLSYSDKLIRLDEACIAAIDGTYEALKRSDSPVNSRMLKTRKSLESKKIP